MHKITPEECETIVKSVLKVLIVTGDDDNLIQPERSRDLHAMMPVRFVLLESCASMRVCAEACCFVDRVASWLFMKAPGMRLYV